jgi:hypothetical protein
MDLTLNILSTSDYNSLYVFTAFQSIRHLLPDSSGTQSSQGTLLGTGMLLYIALL